MIGYSIFPPDQNQPVEKSKAAVLARNIDPSHQTFQDTYTKASAFAGQTRTSEAFDKASQPRFAKTPGSKHEESDNAVMENAHMPGNGPLGVF